MKNSKLVEVEDRIPKKGAEWVQDFASKNHEIMLKNANMARGE